MPLRSAISHRQRNQCRQRSPSVPVASPFVIVDSESQCVYSTSQFKISCKSDKIKDSDEDIAGMALWSYKGQKQWLLNGVRCKTGYIYIKKSNNISQISSTNERVHGKLFKSLFCCEFTDGGQVFATGFSFHQGEWKFNSSFNVRQVPQDRRGRDISARQAYEIFKAIAHWICTGEDRHQTNTPLDEYIDKVKLLPSGQRRLFSASATRTMVQQLRNASEHVRAKSVLKLSAAADGHPMPITPEATISGLCLTLPDLNDMKDSRITEFKDAIKVVLNPAFGKGRTDFVSSGHSLKGLAVGCQGTECTVSMVTCFTMKEGGKPTIDEVHAGVLLHNAEFVCNKCSSISTGMFIVRAHRAIHVWLFKGDALKLAKEVLHEYLKKRESKTVTPHTDLAQVPCQQLMETVRKVVNEDLDEPYKTWVGVGNGPLSTVENEGSNCVKFCFRLFRHLDCYDADKVLGGLSLPKDLAIRLENAGTELRSRSGMREFKRQWNEAWDEGFENDFLNPYKRRKFMAQFIETIGQAASEVNT